MSKSRPPLPSPSFHPHCHRSGVDLDLQGAEEQARTFLSGWYLSESRLSNAGAFF